jgi:hypothetical protein
MKWEEQKFGNSHSREAPSTFACETPHTTATASIASHQVLAIR